MEIRIKHRIVGFVVLVALGIIFIPVIFKGPLKGEQPIHVGSTIPKAPVQVTPESILTVTAEHANKAAVIEQLEHGKKKIEAVTVKAIPELFTTVKEETKGPVTQSPKIPKITTVESLLTKVKDVTKPKAPVKVQKPLVAPLAKAWTVQLATFSKDANAVTLQDKLRKQGFKAYTATRLSKGTKLTRVYVGPVVKRAEANDLQQKLEKIVHMKGIVVSFSPVSNG